MQQVHPCPPALEGGDLVLPLAGHLALSCRPPPASPAGPADSGLPTSPDSWALHVGWCDSPLLFLASGPPSFFIYDDMSGSRRWPTWAETDAKWDRVFPEGNGSCLPY